MQHALHYIENGLRSDVPTPASSPAEGAATPTTLS